MYVCMLYTSLYLQIPQVNVTIPDDATDDEIYELERTLYIPPENLTAYNATLVYMGVVHDGGFIGDVTR